jgi:hypothetical protein
MVDITARQIRRQRASGRGTGMVGYKVQTAVVTKHHLIVAHGVTNIGNYRSQSANMSASDFSASWAPS